MAPFDHDYYRTLIHSRIGAVVHYREETASTMDDARAGAAAAGDASHRAAYVAGRQTAGRGRQGRPWASEPGDGLYATYHIRTDAQHGSSLYAVAGAMAAADAVHETTALQPALKWPNDLLLQGRKLAGILAEASHGGRLDIFLGIGINIRSRALPPELRDIATSIEDAGAPPPSVEALLAVLSAALEHRLTQLNSTPSSLLEDWRVRLLTLGQRVRLASPDGRTIEGEAVDVSPRGDLVLRHDDGTLGEYAAGDATTA